ncbi:MAG: VOC family protein [Salinivirgaceae bacterium]|nr:VOC family protein [Salinivirgaceae bacterium]
MSIQGISHITFVVKDLERAKHFFCDGLGADEVYDSSVKNFSISNEKFFVLGGVWIAVMAGEPSTDRTYWLLRFKRQTMNYRGLKKDFVRSE